MLISLHNLVIGIFIFGIVLCLVVCGRIVVDFAQLFSESANFLVQHTAEGSDFSFIIKPSIRCALCAL